MKRGLSALAVVALAFGLTAAMSVLTMPHHSQSTVLARPTATLALVDYGAGTVRLHRLDPRTLLDMKGNEPLELGHHYGEALSPDGRILAVVMFSTERDPTGELHLVDLRSWSKQATRIEIKGEIGPMAFGTDSRTVSWVRSRRWRGPEYEPNAVLERYDLRSRRVRTGPSFAPAFEPWSMRALPGGALAVYGTESVRVDGLVADATSYVDVVEGDGAMKRVALARVKTTTPQPGAVGDPPDRAAYWPGLAWDTSHDRLYIAHSDNTAITAVDLTKGVVALEAPIRPRRSLAAAIGAWFVPPAEAKGAPPGGERQAVVSPDGDMMYVTGSRTELTRLGPERWIERRTPYGVSAVATDGLTERSRADGMFEAAHLSPDGTRLLATGRTWEVEFGGTDSTISYNGLTLFEAPELDVVAHLWPEADAWVLGFSGDGNLAYAVWCERPTLKEVTGTLASIDIASGAVVAERPVPTCAPRLLAPFGPQAPTP
jgi:hypothetical protein